MCASQLHNSYDCLCGRMTREKADSNPNFDFNAWFGRKTLEAANGKSIGGISYANSMYTSSCASVANSLTHLSLWGFPTSLHPAWLTYYLMYNREIHKEIGEQLEFFYFPENLATVYFVGILWGYSVCTQPITCRHLIITVNWTL